MGSVINHESRTTERTEAELPFTTFTRNMGLYILFLNCMFDIQIDQDEGRKMGGKEREDVYVCECGFLQKPLNYSYKKLGATQPLCWEPN